MLQAWKRARGGARRRRASAPRLTVPLRQAERSALRLPAKTTSFQEWAERLDAYARSLSPEAVERELGHWAGLAGLPFDRLPFEPAERTDPSTGLVASSRTVTVELDEAGTRAR